MSDEKGFRSEEPRPAGGPSKWPKLALVTAVSAVIGAFASANWHMRSFSLIFAKADINAGIVKGYWSRLRWGLFLAGFSSGASWTGSDREAPYGRGGYEVSRITSNMAKCGLIAVVAILLVGCATSKMKQENENLKTQVQNLHGELAAARDENARLSQEKVGMESELSKTRAEYAANQKELEAMTKKLAGQGFEVAMRGGMMVVTMPQRILYGSGKAELASTGKDKLKTLAQTLNKELKGFPVEVQGHTDTDPILRTKDKYKSNWELSYDRAQTVAYYLISVGVDAKRIHASAYGQYSSVSSNATAEGKAKNRRVEIVVMQSAAGQ